MQGTLLPHFRDRKGIWLGRLGNGVALAVSVLVMGHLVAGHRGAPASVSDNVSGDLRIVGSHTLERPVGRWVAVFSQAYPNVTIHTALYGSGVAANEMAEGRADLAPLARPLSADERLLVSRKAPPPIAILVGMASSQETPASLANPAGDAPVNSNGKALYIYLPSATTVQRRRLALAFVAVALSADGQAAIARAHLDPLPANARRRAITQLRQLAVAAGEKLLICSSDCAS